MKNTLILISAIAMLAACKSQERIVTVEKVRTDTTYITRHERDSIHIHDSIHVYETGDTVLDNCMGSGTTAIACIKERRHFIGFELNKEYFDKACKRIKAEQAQLTLF